MNNTEAFICTLGVYLVVGTCVVLFQAVRSKTVRESHNALEIFAGAVLGSLIWPWFLTK